MSLSTTYSKHYSKATVGVASSYLTPNLPQPLITSGSGWFIQHRRRLYIITSAHVVSTVNNGSLPRTNPPPVPYPLTKNNTIYVQVLEYIYTADLLGLDPGTDVAVLSIDPNKNKALPPLDNIPVLSWEEGSTKPGASCTISSNGIPGAMIPCLTKGVVANPNYGPGNIGTKLLLTDADALQGASGSPILNRQGRVIALLIESVGDSLGNTLNGGPITKVVQPVCEQLIGGYGNLVLVRDPTGDYYRYSRGFMGFTYDIYNSSVALSFPDSLYRKMQGIFLYSTFENSPAALLFGYPLSSPTIITEIDGKELGQGPEQTLPSIITWPLGPGGKIRLTYRLASERFGRVHEGVMILANYPPELNVPNGNLSEKGNIL